MFRLAFFVEDKNLAKVLVAVQGLALNMEVPQPVVNATVVKGKVALESAGVAAWERLWDEVIKRPKGSVYTAAELKADIRKIGGQETSISYFSRVLKDNGVLKKGKGRGEFIITTGKEK